MNDTIRSLLNHRSIRSYADKPLSTEQIGLMVQCAQAASTSSYVQAYSIIGVKDKARKERLAELAGGQSYVAKNGHFFIFCLDLHRLELAASLESPSGDNTKLTLESTESFMVATIDAALAAQNAVVAAESMGLGVCYIGGLRNQLGAVTQLLQTPDRVIPLFGLSVGYPANLSDQKPRLPMSAVYHEETYAQDEVVKRDLIEYDQVISGYYRERTGGARDEGWTDAMSGYLDHPKRLEMKAFLASKKLPLA